MTHAECAATRSGIVRIKARLLHNKMRFKEKDGRLDISGSSIIAAGNARGYIGGE